MMEKDRVIYFPGLFFCLLFVGCNGSARVVGDGALDPDVESFDHDAVRPDFLYPDIADTTAEDCFLDLYPDIADTVVEDGFLDLMDLDLVDGTDEEDAPADALPDETSDMTCDYEEGELFLEKYCVYIVSCVGDGLEHYLWYLNGVSDCIFDLEWFYRGRIHDYPPSEAYFASLFGCLDASMGDCDALIGCYNHGHGIEPCDETAFESRCDGSVTVNCRDGVVRYWDCLDRELNSGYSPMLCVIEASGADCQSPCEGYEPYHDFCIGHILYDCDASGTPRAIDCLVEGTGCTMPTSTTAECIGDGPACDDSSYDSHCDADTLIYCSGGREMSLDCGELIPAFTCNRDLRDHFHSSCVPSGSECDPIDHDDYCCGDAIVYCRAGNLMQVSCRDLGYVSCAIEDGMAACM